MGLPEPKAFTRATPPKNLTAGLSQLIMPYLRSSFRNTIKGHPFRTRFMLRQIIDLRITTSILRLLHINPIPAVAGKLMIRHQLRLQRTLGTQYPSNVLITITNILNKRNLHSSKEAAAGKTPNQDLHRIRPNLRHIHQIRLSNSNQRLP